MTMESFATKDYMHQGRFFITLVSDVWASLQAPQILPPAQVATGEL